MQTLDERARAIYEWNSHAQMSAPRWEDAPAALRREILAAAALSQQQRIADGKWLTYEEAQRQPKE